MAFCGSCSTHVRHEDIAMLRDRGKCTRCEMHRLLPRPAPSLAQARAATVLGHGILIGVPAAGTQREIGDAPAASAVPHS